MSCSVCCVVASICWRHLSAYLCHTVCCAYRASHVDGLCQRHRHGIHVACVGAERIHHLLSQMVERFAYCRAHASEQAAYVRCLVGADYSLLHHVAYHRGDFPFYSRCHVGAYGVESGLLLFAQERNLAAGEFVASYGVDVRQILCLGCLLRVFCHLLLQACRTECLVVAQRHCAATVKTQHLLCLPFEGEAGCGYN